MEAADGLVLTAEHALDLHEAAGIVGNHNVGSGLEEGLAFDVAHGFGDVGEFDREGSSEAAAAFGFAHFNEFEALDVFEEFAGLVLDAEFAQAVAAIVEGGLGIEAGTDVLDSELGHEEVGEFPDLGGEGLGFFFPGVAGEEFGVEDFEHGAAGTGGRDDDVGVGEEIQHTFGRAAGFVPVARVESGLAAAGLAFRVIHGVAEAFEDLDDADPDFGVVVVDKAGDEEGNAHWEDYEVRSRVFNWKPCRFSLLRTRFCLVS